MNKEQEMANFLNNRENWKPCKEIGNYLTVYDGNPFSCPMMADGTFDLDDDGNINYSEVDYAQLEDSIGRWNALCENKPQPERELITLVKKLRDTVQEMSNLYERFESLNDTITMGRITPMSLDEWVMEIYEWIDAQELKFNQIFVAGEIA